ncbi:MAG: type II secretion system protein [Candidatus Levybacteria bacterium]|nr:type II secretion system protein [Candidatus Levybacteria bacterium]
MEEEKVQRRNCSFWSVSCSRDINKFIFWKNHSRTANAGFTLVELLIDLAILGILIAFIVFLIDPVKQLNKAKDSQKKHNLIQIKTALDTYYNDHNCYPKSTDFTFGGEFKDFLNASVVYMKQVPQELNCLGSKTYCYAYQVNEDADCPQWNVIYTKLYDPTSDSYAACPLTKMSEPCLPLNYLELGYNGCTFSGSIDCSYISSHVLPTQPIVVPTQAPTAVIPSPTAIPTETPLPTNISITPSPTLTPILPLSTITPHPTEVCSSSRNYACTGGPPARCNLVYPGTGTFCSSNCNGECL